VAAPSGLLSGRELQRELKAKLRTALPDMEAHADRPKWIVVGGIDKGGIVVRAGVGLDSTMYPVRLSDGARIEELEREGNRLHYQRIRGDGPDFGWVNVTLNGKVLVEPELDAPNDDIWATPTKSVWGGGPRGAKRQA